MNLMDAICIQNHIPFFQYNNSLKIERINNQHMLLESAHITISYNVLLLCLLNCQWVIQLWHNT